MRDSYLCPACDCGEIHKARIKGTDKSILICGECDVVFKDLTLLEGEPFHILMERLGLEGVWSQLEDIVILQKNGIDIPCEL